MKLYGSDKSVSAIDCLIFLAVSVFCFFSFQHPDIIHTGGSSLAYLNGHFMDFYEANLKDFSVNNYLPSTYIVFAIWNIPLKLFNLVHEPTNVGYIIFWYKLLPTLFYFASAFVIYKIGLTLGMTINKSKLLSLFWLTTPIAFFSQFIFGQYDILTTFFVLLGLLYYLKKDNKKFILFFAISMTFKYFPLFIFIPLLLLIEKNIYKLILRGLLLLTPLIIEVLLYIHSNAFIKGVFGFSANQRLFTAGLKIEGNINISFFLIIWLLICTFAFLKHIKDESELIKWALYLPMAVSSLLFSMILWHPQWLLFATPFLALTTFTHKKFKFFNLIDILMMFFFIGFTVNFWTGGVDQSLWKLGVFGNHINADLTDPDNIVFMSKFFVPHDTSIYYSAIVACFFVNIIFKFPLLQAWYENENEDTKVKKENYLVSMRFRFILGVSIFILPALISVLAIKAPPIYNVKSQDQVPIGEIVQQTNVGQVFKAKASQLNSLKIRMATYNRLNSSHLKFSLYKYDVNKNVMGDVLYSKIINSDEIKDNEFYEIKLKNITLNQNEYYSFNIESDDAAPGNAVTVWHTINNEHSDEIFATLNGIKQNYNLNFVMYGK